MIGVSPSLNAATGWLAALAVLLVACSQGGGEITVDVEVTGDGVTRSDDVSDGCPRYPSPLTDRDIGDALIEPGDTLVLDHRWEVGAEHVDGATLLILGIGGEALIDLGS